jgi:hypothetical protein
MNFEFSDSLKLPDPKRLAETQVHLTLNIRVVTFIN